MSLTLRTASSDALSTAGHPSIWSAASAAKGAVALSPRSISSSVVTCGAPPVGRTSLHHGALALLIGFELIGTGKIRTDLEDAVVGRNP